MYVKGSLEAGALKLDYWDDEVALEGQIMSNGTVKKIQSWETNIISIICSPCFLLAR